MPISNPSPDQLSIFDWITNGSGSVVISAVAGSGKTTTIVHAQELIPTYNSVLFLAFNKNIVTELTGRLPRHVQVKTFHSHGMTAYQRWLGKRPLVNADKTRDIIKKRWEYKQQEMYANFVQKIISYAKSAGVGHLCDNVASEWFALITYFNLTLDSRDADEGTAVRLAMEIFAESIEQINVIDFDDMLFMPLIKNCAFDLFQWVFIDEAQDTNAVQRELLARMFNKSTGRLVAVGDPSQAIYGFRGADSDSMNLIARDFNCKTLALSVSWRCAKSIVAVARQHVSHIHPSSTAPEGSVISLSEYEPSIFAPTDVILCRVTNPLVSLAFGFIRRNVGVHILGREIGKALVDIVKKFNASDIDSLEPKLEAWRSREYNKAIAKNNEAAAELINDRADCIRIFMDNQEVDSISALCRMIESLFDDSKTGLLTLCTVHKSKGLEWETVFILDRDAYMPSKYAKQDWQIAQEYNLIYVAVTRAKLNLRYIKSGGWKEKKSAPQSEREKLLEEI